MIPQLIQTAQIEPEQEKDYLQEILSKTNPYVTKSANIAPLQSLYDVLHPHLYLGHEYPARLRKREWQWCAVTQHLPCLDLR